MAYGFKSILLIVEDKNKKSFDTFSYQRTFVTQIISRLSKLIIRFIYELITYIFVLPIPKESSYCKTARL